jgi:hypothetical protein
MLTFPPNWISSLGLHPTGDLGPYTIYTTKRNRVVAFPKAPPTSPPTRPQQHQRDLFRLAACTWRAFLPARRAAWTSAARRAHLTITGYNLFVHAITTGRRDTVATVARQAKIALLPIHGVP